MEMTSFLIGYKAGSAKAGSGSYEIPVFDLGAMGLATVPVEGGTASVKVDATEIFEALNQGPVTFAIPTSMSGNAMTGYCTMFSFTDGASMHQCSGTLYLSGVSHLFINVTTTTITLLITPVTALIDSYIGDTLGGDY